MNHIIKKVFVIIGMVFVAWILILLFAIDALFQRFYGWVGFCGGILAFALSVFSLALWRPHGGRDTAEIAAFPLIFTGMYFTAALFANTLFCFLAYLEFPRVIPLMVNMVLTITFVTVRMFILPYHNRVLYMASLTTEKTHNTISLSAKLGEMLGMT